MESCSIPSKWPCSEACFRGRCSAGADALGRWWGEGRFLCVSWDCTKIRDARLESRPDGMTKQSLQRPSQFSSPDLNVKLEGSRSKDGRVAGAGLWRQGALSLVGGLAPAIADPEGCKALERAPERPLSVRGLQQGLHQSSRASRSLALSLPCLCVIQLSSFRAGASGSTRASVLSLGPGHALALLVPIFVLHPSPRTSIPVSTPPCLTLFSSAALVSGSCNQPVNTTDDMPRSTGDTTRHDIPSEDCTTGAACWLLSRCPLLCEVLFLFLFLRPSGFIP